jgi:hypothetical protein
VALIPVIISVYILCSLVIYGVTKLCRPHR